MSRQHTATIDAVVFAMAAKADGVSCCDVAEKVAKANPGIAYSEVTVRLHRLRRAGKLVGRYDRQQTMGVQIRNFLTEEQADACQTVVKDRAATISSRDGGRRRLKAQGVKTLADLRLRCVIDSETGCWLWRGAASTDKRTGARTTRVWLPSTDKTHTGQAAGWMLAGKPLPAGHVVWRSACDRWDCVNPAHAAAGTRQQMFAFVAASGRLKGQPHRMVANLRNNAKQAIARERVEQAEAMFARGCTQKEVRATLGIASDTARAIRYGRHINSSSRRMVSGASVFSLSV